MATKTSKNYPEQSDSELIEATLEAITSSLPVGLAPGQAAAAAGRVARTAYTRPGPFLRRGVKLLAEQAKIMAGASSVEIPEKDRRFADIAWTTNPVYRRLGQSYLAWNQAAHDVVDDLGLDDKSRLRAEFLLNLVTETVAPTNTLLGNPAALNEARRTKGKSLIDGLRHAAHDIRHNGAMPSMVDTRPFIPGDTIAATPGAVVYQNAVLELIQYTPTTARVHERPMVIVPPQINKYYILDLAPGRSLIEHTVKAGHQVFAISWRNPGPEQRDWDLNTYVAAVLEGIDAAIEITGSEDVNLLGVCAGGITAAAMLGHLAAVGDTRVNSASYLVTILDWTVPSTMGTFISRPMVNAATRRSQAKSMLPGDDLNRLFAWLRPNDLVWNYVVNNYLMGKNPPAFDVLAWNVDSTNLPAALHADFMEMAVDNQITKAGALEVLDTPIDLKQVEIPSFVVGAVTDHITPWQACYETVNLLGGKAEFVLSSQGHIQALVNPSGNPKGKYFTNQAVAASPADWQKGAKENAGSWWDYWTKWLKAQGGRRVVAPSTLGSANNPAGEAAPGQYVLG